MRRFRESRIRSAAIVALLSLPLMAVSSCPQQGGTEQGSSEGEPNPEPNTEEALVSSEDPSLGFQLAQMEVAEAPSLALVSVSATPTVVASPSPSPAPSVTVVQAFSASLLQLAPQFTLATFTYVYPYETWWCRKATGATCTQSELSNPTTYRQILIMPTGFGSGDYQLFRQEFARLTADQAATEGDYYSRTHKNKILYLGYWLPGGALGTQAATFKARVAAHPVRGKALTLDQSLVHSKVAYFRTYVSSLSRPWAVGVLFNTLESGITANASPPSFIRRDYGIAKFTREDVGDHYTVMHELAHAGLNFADEYREGGLQETSITQLDPLTPLLVLQGFSTFFDALANLFGYYSFRVSEIMASNGSDNVDVTPYTSRVSTNGYTPNVYEYAGGMFFGRGTYHDRGFNIMNGSSYPRGQDDGFGWAHSQSQLTVVNQAFGSTSVALRPNDRIRAAGPHSDWIPSFGSSARVILFDGDKNHRYHKTKAYTVQIGWYERNWKTCWTDTFIPVPYPCYTDDWKVYQKDVQPSGATFSLESSAAFAIASFSQSIFCQFTGGDISMGGNTFDLCTGTVADISNTFVPSMVFPSPYQDVSVPTSQIATRYWWRFRTFNGTHTTGFNAWSSLYRLF